MPPPSSDPSRYVDENQSTESSGRCAGRDAPGTSGAPADAQLDVNAIPQVPSSHATGHRTPSSAPVQAAAGTQADVAIPRRPPRSGSDVLLCRIVAKAIVSLGNLWMMKAVVSRGATAWVVNA